MMSGRRSESFAGRAVLRESEWSVAARRVLLVCLLCLVAGRAVLAAQRYEDFITPTPLAEGATLVIGFLGGRESWDNQHRGVRKLALKLRAMRLSGVHVETVENTKRPVALALVRNAFDRDRNGQLDEPERASARVIVYGQSFGGAAVVKFARQLDTMGVPVLLTVQVDSVGREDAVIPPNVARAANLFQRDGFTIRGEREIRAADPRRTTILGNHRFTYRGKTIDLSEVSWFKRLLQRAHTKMDFDPEVWALVEKTILDVLATDRTDPIPSSHGSHGLHRSKATDCTDDTDTPR